MKSNILLLLLALACISGCDQIDGEERAIDPAVEELRVTLGQINYGRDDSTQIFIHNQSPFSFYFGRCCSDIQIGIQSWQIADSTWVDNAHGIQKPCGAFCPTETNPIGPDSTFTQTAVFRNIVLPGQYRLAVEYWSEDPNWQPTSRERLPYGTGIAYSVSFVIE